MSDELTIDGSLVTALQPGCDLDHEQVYARDFDAAKGMPWALRNGAVRAARFAMPHLGISAMRIVSVHLVAGRPYVQAEVEVKHRDTGQRIDIAFVRDVDRDSAHLKEDDLTDAETRRLVWQTCLLTLAHELDESLLMDGKRLREAHPGDEFPDYDFRRMDGPPVTLAEVRTLQERVARLEREKAVLLAEFDKRR